MKSKVKKLFNKHYFLKKSEVFSWFKENRNFFPSINDNIVKLQFLLKKEKYPLFILSTKVIQNRIDTLIKHASNNNISLVVAYSLKTNYEFLRTSILKKNMNIKVEVVSDEEYSLAKRYKVPRDKIVYNGPYKKKESLYEALCNKSIVHIDNFSEFKRVISMDKSLLKGARLGFRWKHRKGEEKSRFGMEEGEIIKAIKKFQEHKIFPAGLHVHLGTDIYNLTFYKNQIEHFLSFSTFLENKFKFRFKYLDLGGGFPAHGMPPKNIHVKRCPLISEYIKIIFQKLSKYQLINKKIILEPGRYLIDDAGIFVASVVQKKEKKGGQIVLLNATINMLPLTWYRPQIIKLYTSKLFKKKQNMKKTKIYGSTCQENDCFYRGYFPELEEDDLCIFFVTGAYNSNMANNFIFRKPKTYFI